MQKQIRLHIEIRLSPFVCVYMKGKQHILIALIKKKIEKNDR